MTFVELNQGASDHGHGRVVGTSSRTRNSRRGVARTALSLGVPDSDIIVVGRASNTEGEARAVREHFAANPMIDADTGKSRPPRIILVTSAFHMTRAESLFRAAGLDVTPFPVDFRGPTRITLRSFIPSGIALAQTELALHEMYGRVYYWLRGLVVGWAI